MMTISAMKIVNHFAVVLVIIIAIDDLTIQEKNLKSVKLTMVDFGMESIFET